MRRELRCAFQGQLMAGFQMASWRARKVACSSPWVKVTNGWVQMHVLGVMVET